MPNWLRQSTAADIGLGPFVDSTDGDTPETALTITAPDIRLKKNGGAWAQKNAAQTLSHEENGWYEVALDTVDTNTLGTLIIAIRETGALAVWEKYMVVPANVYDAIVLGSDKLEVDTVQLSSDGTAADNAELFFDGTGYEATNSEIGKVGIVYSLDADIITAASIAANAGTEIATAVWALATRTLTGTQAFNNTGTWTGNVTGSVGSVTGSVGSVTGAVGSVTAMVTANATQISGDSTAADNLETMLDGTGGQTLTLKSLIINNPAGVAVGIQGTTDAVQIVGGNAGVVLGGGADYGLISVGVIDGILLQGGGAGAGINSIGGATGAGIQASGGASSGPGIKTTGVGSLPGLISTGGITGSGIQVLGGASSGEGLYISAQGGNSIGLLIEGDGSGADIDANITGNLIGNITGSLASVATGGITAASIATDAIGADELAASAVAEIVSAIGGVGAFAITVTVNDGAAALQNVDVSIYDGGGALAGRGTTDASGNASFSLAAGTYTVTLVKANYQFAPASRTVTGNQAGSLVTPMSMAIIAPIAASGNPNLCVVAGYIKDLNGNPLVGSLVKARLVPPNSKRPITADGDVLGLEADTAVTDALGYVSMELIRTDSITPDGCSYTFKCQDAQMEERNVQLITATLDIATL